MATQIIRIGASHPHRFGELTQPAVRGSKTPQLTKEQFTVAAESRLWKACMKNADPKNGRIELIVYLFFGAFVAASVLVSLSELVHLLDSNALYETVRDLM